MARNFLPCDRDQELLLPPSVREWLPEDHLAWFVLDAVDEIELSAFYAAYREDGWGRAAFDPGMMVALLLYAYAIGERSSRRIEQRCREDVAFRVICANQIPDHVTISRFRVRHECALAETFTEVLRLCGEAGLVAVGLVALDGTLLAASASHAATRSYASICEEVEEMLDEAARVDAEEDQRLGAKRGDELPPELADRGSRRARLARCKEQLEQQHAAKEAAYQAKLRERAAWEAKLGKRLGGRKPHAPDPSELTGSRLNTTDPDSRPMKRAGRSLQGYNVQLVASPEQVIIAAEVSQSGNDSEQLRPLVTKAQATLAAAGLSDEIGTVLADGGYWSAAEVAAVRASGIEALIPPSDRRRARVRRYGPPQGPEATRMEALLEQPAAQALYRRRQQIAEPIFAHTKLLRRSDRFLRRGLAACQAEWCMIAATHNLLKLWRARAADHPLAVAA